MYEGQGITELQGLFGYVEPGATALAALVAIFSAWNARRSATVRSEETQHQAAIALESMLLEHHTAIQSWAGYVLDWIARAHTLTFFDPKRMPEGALFFQRAECLSHLSSLIDRGRLLFPNEVSGDHTTRKPSAYRGLAPTVLDKIKEIFDLLTKLSVDQTQTALASEIGEKIAACKRDFVSAAQAAVDPRAREERLTTILKRAAGPQG